jgi:cytochrome c-type biogenesis protein CcmE
VKRFIFLIFTVVTLLILLSYQATISAASAVYTPSQLVESEKDLKRVRVGGKVAKGDIDYQTEPNMVLKFYIRDIDNSEMTGVPVIYKGLKPDMFAVDRDVIIDGDYINNVLVASTLLTQCPSKYEPPKPTK